MVAAKLDQSRVLVTKFHENRSTLKGRNAGQRHTHTQIDRQTHRQTRLKIMALQVCNQANKLHFIIQCLCTCGPAKLITVSPDFSSFSLTTLRFQLFQVTGHPDYNDLLLSAYMSTKRFTKTISSLFPDVSRNTINVTNHINDTSVAGIRDITRNYV